MKKSVKFAVAASVLTMPAMAANVPGQLYSTVHNMENPLYLPEQNMFYSKLSNGIMLKVADNSWAHREKNHDGGFEFPIVRVQEEMGYGITDRWATHFMLQYTHDNDIGRTGLSGGRLGTTYRILNLYNGFVWDVYGDIHLGGVGEMRGTYNVKGDLRNPSSVYGVFDYDNYSDGMWGFHAGTKFGHVWDKLTLQVYAEVLRTFADDNNMIRVVGDTNGTIKNIPGIGNVMMSPATQLAMFGAPSQISAKIKGYTDFSAGINGFYQFSDRWSTGGWFKFNRHSDKGVEKITTKMPNEKLQALKLKLEEQLADMEDGWDEYVIGVSVANQLTDNTQVTLYGEYTFDDSHRKSQNGTDVKAEMGVRLNFTF